METKHNPEKYAPQKFDLNKLKMHLSQKQIKRIEYECLLLKKTIEEMLIIAPFLFTEGITASNTNETKIEPKEEEKDDNHHYSQEHFVYDNDGFYDEGD